MASVEMCRRNVHSKSNCGTKIELGKADMLRSKRKFEVGKIFFSQKKNTVVFSDDWASNASKQNSRARRFSLSARRLKCDS